jgi:hypothetical protein
MTAHSQLFTERQAICPESILIANSNSISAIATGTACITVISNSGISCVDLSGTLLAPALRTNLISVLRLVHQGLVVIFQNNAVVVLDKQQRILACGVKEHSHLVYVPVVLSCKRKPNANGLELGHWSKHLIEVCVAIWRSFALGATGNTIHGWRSERMLERRTLRF